jgi:hydroxymethylbilane synthase
MALYQAGLVRDRLRAAHPDLAGEGAVELVAIRTTGDRVQTRLLAEIGGKGLFTKEIEEALLDGRIDLAVHSLKDVPSAVPDGLAIAAVPEREDPRDVLLSHPRSAFAELPRGARVGTSSPRRQAQLRAARPDLEILEARGNVDTRIRRMQEGRFDALVLARAGLARLGRLAEVVEVFDETLLLPAVGQGALAIVTRAGGEHAESVALRLDHAPSHRAILAERAFLETLEAGCRAPVAGRARVDGDTVTLAGAVFSLDGLQTLRGERSGSAPEADALGRALASDLLARGAAALIARVPE